MQHLNGPLFDGWGYIVEVGDPPDAGRRVQETLPKKALGPVPTPH